MVGLAQTKPDRSSGSPYDRGEADAWYGRPGRPHKWLGGDFRLEASDLTGAEQAEYWRGYAEGDWAQKEWE